MKSATSLLNRTLLNHFAGGVFWLTVLFLIGNILIQPLALWIASSYIDTMGGRESLPDNPLKMMIVFQLAGGMIYTVLMVLFLFNYKNTEASLDFMHSLPIKKKGLLTHALIVGIANITVPMAITAIILFLERYFLTFEVTFIQIVEWFFYTLFVLFVVFAAAVFLGFLVNSIFVHLQLVVIVFFLPLVFWGLTVTVADMLYDGISTSPDASEGLMGVVTRNTFPFFAMQQVFNGLVMWRIIMWTGLAVLLIGFSYILYNRSRNENIHHTFTNNWVRDILVAFITISGMLLVGLIISFALPRLTVLFVLAFIIGAVFSYIIQEMFFQGTAKIEYRKHSIVTTAISVALFWIIFIFSWQQYTTYVPDENDVESVSINGNWSGMYSAYGGKGEKMSEEYMFISDPVVINQALSLHKEVIDQARSSRDEYMGEGFEISYRMDDGKYISRQYDYISMDNAHYNALLETLEDSRFSTAYDTIYHITDVAGMKTLDVGGVNGHIQFDDPEETEAFVKDYRRAARKVDGGMSILNSTADVPLATVSVDFGSEYYSGMASIYNEALLEAIGETHDIANFIGAADSQAMYTLSLAEEEKEAFFADYQSQSLEELNEAYELEAVKDENRDEITAAINEGALDAGADRVLLYSPQQFIQESGPGRDEAPAAETYYMIGIKQP